MKTKTILTWSIVVLFSISSFAQESSSAKKSTTPGRDGAINITKERILEAKNIEEILNNFPINDYVVTHFRMTIAGKGINLTTLENNNDQLTPLMKEKIKSAPTGSKIYIDYVKGSLKSSNEGLQGHSFPLHL